MIGSHLLHALAWSSVKLLPPTQAYDVVTRVGALLPTLTSERAKATARRLRGGTCLTRAMTIAARVPASTVVIGASKTVGAFSAHAWVDLDGEALTPQVPNQTSVVIGRLV